MSKDSRSSFDAETQGMMGAGLRAPSDPVTERMLRLGFIRKVYGILSAQLALTFGMIFVFVFVEPVKVQLCGMNSVEDCNNCEEFRSGHIVMEFEEANESCMWRQRTHEPGPHKCNLHPSGGCFRPTPAIQSWLMVTAVLTIVFVCGIVCCEKCAKSVPTNYIVLFSFTACEAVMLGLTCLFVNASAVGLAAAMTALVTAGLTVYAVTTKTDYSAMGGYFFAALLTLIVFGFVGSIFSMFFHVPWLQNVYAGCGCLVFSMYIVYDTQLIVGSIGNGERHGQFQIGYDDYVFAALNIYLDIINLFQYILILLNSRD